jgi:ATP-dependent RNA helicase SUPV3L1/SUV3
LQALLPHFNLRADRFYNAPDTEIDFTEQGGLMWGDQAVGKLTAGDDVMHPRVVAFVDSEAGAEALNKVERRLQHFIDRKISVLFEPLINLQKDEELTGLARGFGFQLSENLGILRRQKVSAEVKSLDQDARGLLRKHGVRFGQFTVFMPLLLKPAPTRLRLVLWALLQNLEEFPEAPPPGLVTVPVNTEVPVQYDDMSGYRNAGERAIRIDMLERLADLLRAENSRSGFEANADMLSITGMTLEQFASLMEGLGYSAEKAEREKIKTNNNSESTEVDDQKESNIDLQNKESNLLPEIMEDQGEPTEKKNVETFYTFKWISKQIKNRRSDRDKNSSQKDGETGKPKFKRKENKKQKVKSDKPKSFEALPKKENKIDPDNPFAAALMNFSKKN